MSDREQLADQIEPVNQGIADTLRATSDDWWSRASRAVDYLASTGRPFTAYDLVSVCGIEEPDRPASQWGSLFSAKRTAGVIVHAGFVRSPRPTVKGSACSQWIGKAAPIQSERSAA
ncbi:hypothetical protein KGD82_16795 [Nocardiopsis eucommiae]|uniref:Uncharacterized protein n=1 Tax=Nocardiopsis eucommiae TaxID=2831970 RepID=A0A975L840_9ACTN|nr:hypothetical protein KGD82_16795 [Nocardiopsis eucommiae]